MTGCSAMLRRRPAARSGRLVSVCGAIGVSTIASTAGCTIGPPAAGCRPSIPSRVATIRPSALTCADELAVDRRRRSRSSATSAPRVTTTSLSARWSRDAAARRARRGRASISRVSTCVVPAERRASSARVSSARLTSVRKPRRPKLTPRIGDVAPGDARCALATPSSVPSPPNAMTTSHVVRQIARARRSASACRARRAPRCRPRRPARTPRASSQAAASASAASAAGSVCRAIEADARTGRCQASVMTVGASSSRNSRLPSAPVIGRRRRAARRSNPTSCAARVDLVDRRARAPPGRARCRPCRLRRGRPRTAA